MLDKIFSTVVMILAMIAPQFKKADSKEGNKETLELIKGINEITVKCCEKFKDGVQFSDFTSFYSDFTTDESFKKIMEDAYDKKSKVPAEVKDTDIGEGIEMLSEQVKVVPRIIKVFSSKEVIAE